MIKISEKIKILIIAIVALIIILGFLIFIKEITRLPSEKVMPIIHKKIIHEIEFARFCEKDDHCGVIPSVCPFGCLLAINKNQIPKISNLLNYYLFLSEKLKWRCIHECIHGDKLKCVNRKCSLVFERPEEKFLKNQK